MRKVLPLLACGSMLSACATTSFAPPPINLDQSVGTRSVPIDRCMRSLHAGGNVGRGTARDLSGGKPVPIAERGTAITEDFDGAMMLIDNFMVGYRCAERSAANGRANFEVPAFLIGATATLGTAFGLSEDAVLGLGAASVASGKSNSYFAPKEKAAYLNSAIDALTCIQLESVGIPGFDLSEKPAGDDDDGRKNNTFGFLTDPSNDGTVSVTAERQYFRMIYGSLLSVERVLARRLSAAGTAFDPSGVVAEIELLTKKEEDDQEELETLEAEVNAAIQSLQTANVKSMDGSSAVVEAKKRLQQAKSDYVTLKVKDLQPKLQKCVVKAKV